METENLLTTREVANLLDVKTATVLKYTKEGKLTPYTDDPYQIDTTKLFKESDVLRFQLENQKPGLTTGDVARQLGIHTQSVKNHIKSGELRGEKQVYKGKEIYFISEADFKDFQETYEMGKRQDMKDFHFKGKEHHLLLFQLFRNEHTREYARVMQVNKKGEGFLITNDERRIPFSDAEFDEFLPIKKLEDQSYILKKGYAVFSFDVSEDIMSPVFKLLDLFYSVAGPKNMKLLVENQKIHLEIKPVNLEMEVEYHQEEISILKDSIIEGTIKVGREKVVIDSDVDPITVTVPTQLKNRLKNDAKIGKMSLDEYVLSIIKEKYLEVSVK